MTHLRLVPRPRNPYDDQPVCPHCGMKGWHSTTRPGGMFSPCGVSWSLEHVDRPTPACAAVSAMAGGAA